MFKALTGSFDLTNVVDELVCGDDQRAGFRVGLRFELYTENEAINGTGDTSRYFDYHLDQALRD